MLFALAVPAFLAGFLMFLAPCTLPLVPGYLAFISGVSVHDANKNKETVGYLRKKFSGTRSSTFWALAWSSFS